MALLKIRKVGDPVLRSKAKEVVELNAQVIDLLDNMAETMYKAPGAGLAAPQVGVLQRIIVVDVNDENGLIELINPEIIQTSEEQTVLEEGCLSIPGAAYNVIRSRQVKVKGLDRKGRAITIEAEGYLARALQHEIDHLDGVLIIDKGIKIPESNQL